jgi:hypothetical protein
VVAATLFPEALGERRETYVAAAAAATLLGTFGAAAWALFRAGRTEELSGRLDPTLEVLFGLLGGCSALRARVSVHRRVGVVRGQRRR